MTKRRKKSWIGWMADERESVVVDEGDIVHNPAAGYHEFVGVTVEQSDVIRVKKILRRPTDGVCQGIVPELLLID